MKRLIVFIFIFASIMLFNVASISAQTAPNRIDISVNITCSNIEVSLVSDYESPIKAEAFVGNGMDYNLLATVGDFTRANGYGSASRVYTFERQLDNTQLIYSVRVYDDELNVLVDRLDSAGNCGGNPHPAPVTTITQTTTTTSTASFLAACDLTGGITVQPIGGVPFGITSTQIAQGTAMAMANNQNIGITSANGVTVLGTPANAIQLVATDGYTLTIPTVSCTQTISTPTTTVTSVAVQAAQLSCSSVPADAVNTHTVSAGENLFRIGLRYGISFTRLAAYNGIPDATRIFVGQCIGIPPTA